MCGEESSPMATWIRGNWGILVIFANSFPFQHEILYEWINLVYLDMDSQAQIQEEFEERSEILLKDFLKVSPAVQSDVFCQNRSQGWQVPHVMQAGKGLGCTALYSNTF